MNLNQLKLFHLAVKRESLSRAARELNITQPAVTKGIQRLQEFYEVKLVQQIGKKPVLTPAGQALYEITERIFELEKLAEACLLEHQQQQSAHLRIHASESFGVYYLPPVINRFNQSNPHVQVTVEILPNSLVVDNTVNLLNDLGFVSLPVKNKKLTVHGVVDEELVIIMPPDHVLADRAVLEPGDLQGQVMIMHEEGSFFQEVIKTMVAEKGVALSMPITLSNNEAIKRAVEGRAGITLISRKAAEAEIRSGRLKAIPLASSPGYRRFFMIHHREKPVSPAMQHLLDLIREDYPATAGR